MKIIPRILFLIILFSLPAAAGDFYDWSSAPPLHEQYGELLHARLQRESPRMLKINVIRIDLESPRVSFHATPRSENWGEPIKGEEGLTEETRRERTDGFIRKAREDGIKLAAAINASPWRPWPKSPWNVNVSGLLVSGCVVVSPPSGRPSFIESRDFSVRMDLTPAGYDLTGVRTAITGFGFVLEDGEVTGEDSPLHPRTAIGLSEDKRFVYFMTIDGRQPGVSEGASTRDAGEWLLYFGAHTGINMDGGGSTSMAWWDPASEKALILNSPSERRYVGGSIGVSIGGREGVCETAVKPH